MRSNKKGNGGLGRWTGIHGRVNSFEIILGKQKESTLKNCGTVEEIKVCKNKGEQRAVDSKDFADLGIEDTPA